VTDLLDRLRSALADRYRIQRELGAGGMAYRAVRRTGGQALRDASLARRSSGQAVSYYG
jgi:hypothetical protein